MSNNYFPQPLLSLLHAWLLAFMKSLALLVSWVVGLLTMLMTSDANNFVNSKSHARENPLLAGYLETVVVYVFSEHKV